ncbi:hypothetical protein ScPMuIL_007395 [Solemya velum]
MGNNRIGRRADADLPCVRDTLVYSSHGRPILGAVAIGLGIWIVVDDPSFLELAKLNQLDDAGRSVVENGAYVIITGGCAVLLFGILGIVGATLENACLIGTYVALIAVILSLEVAAAVLGIVFKQEWERSLETLVQDNIKDKYDEKSSDTFTVALNTFHQQFQCCGFLNSSDFNYAVKWNKTLANGTEVSVPSSCCKALNETHQVLCTLTPASSNSYTTGCKEALEDLFLRYQGVIIGVGIAIVAGELCLLVLALCLICNVVSNKYSLD